MVMSRQEAGRRGAEALNKNPAKKAAAARKAAATRKRRNPDEFRIMGQKRRKHIATAQSSETHKT